MTPAASPVASARAPGKCILFGEHSVVHGGPELLFALDLYTQVIVQPAAHTSLNADPEAANRNPYLRAALQILRPPGAAVGVRSVSRVPKAAGLGSSSAFVSALASALGTADEAADPEQLARRSFEIERQAQGVGSPGDTSASVAGGYLVVNAPFGKRLWELEADGRRWEVRRVADPGWVWIVAYSGIPRSTADAVRAVSRRLAEPGGDELLRQFAEVATRGIVALGRGDREATAHELELNHALLVEAGVSHPRLEALLQAVRPAALGGKLTGAGCGGSIVVLPKPGEETDAMRRLSRAGAVPFAVRPSPSGAARLEPDGPVRADDS